MAELLPQTRLADDLLFVNKRRIGVMEATAAGSTLSGVETRRDAETARGTA